MTKIDYTLSGCANGHPVRIDGGGTVTPKQLRIAFKAIEAPLTFDAGFVHFAGIDTLLAVAAGLVTPHDGPLLARCRADLLGEGGADLGTITAVVTIERRRGRLACRAQLAEAQVALEPGERVTSIGARTITAMSQWNGVATFAGASIATSRGREIATLASAFLVGASAARRRSLLASSTAVAGDSAVLRLGER